MKTKTKTIKGDLILEKDFKFDGNLVVDGDIKGKDGKRWNINCRDINCRDINCLDINCLDINCLDINAWDINCLDINCLDINCLDINCLDINAWDINAWNIDAGDINAWDIVCEKRILKSKTAKTICRVFVQERNKIEKKDRSDEVKGEKLK